MLLISDNSATDGCLRLAGGAEAVTARMNQLGISGITVSRPTNRCRLKHSASRRPQPNYR